ncbi:ATPase PAAT-like [Cavia porcellus]|uniref:ATPase PAAT-like n=1 Tax=Cavia porcellus TaxID=10141 RepID=UPI002FE3EC5A
METKTGDAGFTRSPTLASSWDAANGALTQSLLLTRVGLSAQNFDWEELLAPPAPGISASPQQGPNSDGVHGPKLPPGAQQLMSIFRLQPHVPPQRLIRGPDQVVPTVGAPGTVELMREPFKNVGEK